MRRILPPVCLAAGVALAGGVAEAATPTRMPTVPAVLVDAAQARSRVVAPSATTSPTRRPASSTMASRAAQQAPPTTTPTATRTAAPVQPTVTATATRPPATPTLLPPTETPRPSPTAERTRASLVASPTPLPTAALPTLARTQQAVRGWQEGSLLVLDVPIRSQLDGSDYQAANCGPASLAMVLEAFDVEARTPLLRNYANLLQGTYGRDDGIALDHLAGIAREAGLRPLGLRDAWSIAAIREQLRQGHPVITLVKMRLLPDHVGSSSETDHYVVLVGLDGQDLLINDPALPGEKGFRRRLSAEQLEAAWAASSIPRHALAIGAAEGVPELRFGEPATTATPAMPAAAIVPSVPEQAQPIVIVITPAPPPVIVLNVPAMPQPMTLTFPTPLPDRWARPGRVYPGEATPVPYAMPPREEAVVLGEALPPTSDPATRWLLRLTLVAAAGNLLRRLLR